MQVFEELSGSRQSRFQGVGEIPYSEVILYGITHGYTGADLVELWEDVHRIDKIFVEAVTKIQKSSKPSK